MVSQPLKKTPRPVSCTFRVSHSSSRKKIPPHVIRDAKGICIYSCMKSGLAPFGGMNGTGLLLGRLPDGSWSAPSCILPNYYSAGLMIGVDLLDVRVFFCLLTQIILIINTEEMLETFKSHKFAVTADTHMQSGPLGTSLAGSVDINKKITPVYSYVHSRGLYAGIELAGQAFLDRFDENERVYYWPGIKAGDILAGKVRIPDCTEPLYRALRDAEYGVAQGGELEAFRSNTKLPLGPDTEQLLANNEDMLKDGEHIHLPPTPAQLDVMELSGYKDEYDEALEKKEIEEIRKLPPPPMHPDVVRFWSNPYRQATPTYANLPKAGMPKSGIDGECVKTKEPSDSTVPAEAPTSKLAEAELPANRPQEAKTEKDEENLVEKLAGQNLDNEKSTDNASEKPAEKPASESSNEEVAKGPVEDEAKKPTEELKENLSHDITTEDQSVEEKPPDNTFTEESSSKDKTVKESNKYGSGELDTEVSKKSTAHDTKQTTLDSAD